MVRRTVVCAIVLLAACATSQVRQASYENTTIAYPFSEATLRRPDVVRCMLKVLELGGYGNLPIERAAFLIYRDDEVFECRLWPATNQHHETEWDGAAPVGVAAVVHSHPARLPNPSPADTRAARRMAVPVLVITLRTLSMVSPGGAFDTFQAPPDFSLALGETAPEPPNRLQLANRH